MQFRALTRGMSTALAAAVAASALAAHGGRPTAALAPAPLAGGSSQAIDDATQAPRVEPRTRVAGIDSLRVTSSVRFPDPTAVPHILDVSLAFPARARVALRSVGGQFGQRVLRYARGAELYGFGVREATSTRIEGANRIDELLSIESRRAAFLWPEAHAWGGDGAERRAEVAGLGTLVAELVPAIEAPATDLAERPSERALRPRRIVALRADGSEVEALEVTGWTRFEARDSARVWPHGLRLWVSGAVVWDEEVLSVERTVPWPEDWFVPPDRRKSRGAAVQGLRAIDLSGAIVREVQVPRADDRPVTVAVALAFAQRVEAEERARGRVLDSRTTLVISPTLEPRAVRLVLADERALVPDGWRFEPPRPAWLVFFDAVAEVRQRNVDQFLLTAPASTQSAGQALWLVVTGEPSGGVQLVLVDAAR